MADLPAKPSLDHLRRQARDLLRAARAGDTTAAAAERPRSLHAGGDERVDGEQDDQRQHRDRGPGQRDDPDDHARMPRAIRDVLSDLNMTVPFACLLPGRPGCLTPPGQLLTTALS